MAHKAFIVGINTLGLQYCERDADLMSACLERYGYEVIRPAATKGDINDQFDELLDSCRKTDTVVLYFSGHGLVKRGTLYFVLADNLAKSRHKIDINYLVERFSDDCRAKNKLMILDCCHANQSVVEWRPDASDRFFILTASERLERSKELDSLQASFLTHRLQHALNEPPSELVEGDKTIRLLTLYEWLVEEAKRHNSRPNAIQVPLPNLLGNHKANFALVTLPDSPDDFPQAISDEERRKQAVEQRYRELALESCDIIDLANLPEDRDVATRELELRRLYVPLRMRVETRADDHTDEDRFEALEKRRQRLLLEPRSREEANKRVSVGERLGKARRLVVLGDPGAGKSTLLRWMATAYLLRLKEDPAWQNVPDVKTLPDEAWLPILIRCRDLDLDQCRYGSLDDFLRQTFRKNEMVDESDTLLVVIKEKLKDGSALLLIDGLDEIGQPSARIRLCQQIEQIERAYPNAPIIVTSRIVGYREMGSYRIKESFEHLTITDFSKEDKDDFARRWCAITERPERRIKATDELIEAIHSNDRIERLTGNPMLLTTLALVKRKVGRLPSRRVDLYHEAVRVLLNWRSEVDEPLDYREAEPQLHYLAYAMCDRGVQQLREDEIIGLLTTMRQEYPHLYPIKNRSPQQFLTLLERRTGILVQIGHVRHDGEAKPVYEFRHLTFQEYLAGLALVKGYFPNRNKSRTLADYVAPLAGRTSKTRREVVVTEAWREPLRLCVAACNDDDVDNVLNAILTPLPNENTTITTRPRAVLAAFCLADEPNASETMADRILQTLSSQVNATTLFPSYLRNAAIELAPSRWGQTLRVCLVQEFCRRDASDREPVGTLCGMVINATIPDNNNAIRAWFAEQITHLASDIEVKAIEVALGITYLIDQFHFKKNYKFRFQNLAKATTKWLMVMLHTNGPKTHAAAWALATLHNRSSKAWRPLLIERETMIAVLNNPTTDSRVVRWLAPILGRERDYQAVEPLMARLDDPEADVRRAIVEALRMIGDPQAVESLIIRLDDPEAHVRAAVASVLGKIGDYQAVEPLMARLDDPDKSVRKAIAEAFGKIGDLQTVELLLARLNNLETAQIRESVAWALGEIGDPQVVSPLIASLNDPDELVRTASATALGKIGNLQAVEPLIRSLDDPDESVCTASATALGKIGNLQAVKPLIVSLDDSDKSVRTASAKALGEIGNPQAVEPLIVSLDDSDKSVRTASAKALGEIGNPQAVEPLIKSLDDPDESVRTACATALGEIGNPQAVGPLIKSLDDPDKSVRTASATALGKIGDLQAVKPLIRSLDDPDKSVRTASANALGEISNPQAVKSLIACLDDLDEWVCRASAMALAKISDYRAVESLIIRLDNPSTEIRKTAAWALGEIGNRQAIQSLIKSLDDPEADVRLFVVLALAKMNHQQVVKSLIKSLDDSDERVRAVAALALANMGEPQAVKHLIKSLDNQETEIRPVVARVLGTIRDARGIKILRERLLDHNFWIRREALAGLAQTCQDEIDRKLLSRNIDEDDPFLDPQGIIDERQLRRATRALKLSMEEVKRRYEALAVRFGLKLAWEA